MNTKNNFKRIALSVIMLLATLCANAVINGGTITLKVGETRYVDADFGGGLTQTGSWTKSNSIFTFVSRGNKSCTIKGNQVGTGTLYYDGVAGSYDVNYYWTVNVVPESNNDDSDDGETGKCGESLTYTYKSATKTLTISGTGSMTDYSLRDAPWTSYRENIKELIIGSGVTRLGDCAFAYCTGLTSVIIPDNIMEMGEYCFAYCSGITSVNISNKMKSIDNGTFRGCTSLSSIDIPDNITEIGDWVFTGCSGLKTVTIGKGLVFESSANAFYSCDNLESVTFHCKEIGYSWFNGVKSIKKIVIGDEVKSIGREGYPSIGSFEGYSNLSTVTIGNNVEFICARAFRNCSSLTTLTIPNSVKNIGKQAFEGCEKLTSITLPNNLTSIERNLFDGCSNLVSIDIPNNVKTIDVFAFSGCSALKEVFIPNSITSIGVWAFEYCSGLKEIWSYINEPFKTSAFDHEVDVDKITLYVPLGTKAKYEATDGWKKIKNIVEVVNDSDKGTEAYPFTPAEAYAYGSTLAANEQSQEDYYIRGMVVSIKEQFGTQYGNATFYISADGTEKDQFYIYRALYLENTKYAGQDQLLRIGDDVMVCGKITNYMGTLPETVQNQAYVVSINGTTSGIEDVKTGGYADAPIYILSGQKVANVKKGIYIVNGKKIVIK